MLGANVMWGLMSPLAKFVMGTGGVTPMTITGLRVAGAMVLFWTASLFGQRERVASADMLKLFAASLLAIVFNQGFHRRWMPRLSPPVCRCWPWSSPRSI